jgi:exosome complex component RRP42
MRETILEYNITRVVELAKEGKRLDGRKLDEMRPITIETDISENAEGSARVRLGMTEVIAGIKLLPSQPYPDSPDQGSISVNAELLPLANAEYEFGPPSIAQVEFSRIVDRGIREGKAIDFKALCIREGELAWTAFVDYYAINADGNLIDAGAIASIVSFIKGKMPKLDENDKVIKHEYTSGIKLQRLPLQSTFVKIAGKIMLDPTYIEEKAAEAKFSVATTEDGYLCSFQKSTGGSFTVQEIQDMCDMAFKTAKEVRKQLPKA